MTELSDRGRRLAEVLPGHYRLVAELGAGGMGFVFKAIDTRLNRAVAIKAVNYSRLAGGVDRLRTEALAAASLDHPYLCKVYEFIEHGDETFIVMEFVEGETLAAVLRRGPLPVKDVVRIASEIAEGLANAHERGLVHRDVKPSNVMQTPSGHVKLLDFGLAHRDTMSPPAADTRSATHGRATGGGTPQYMAPEQATGAPVTARADLFALGVVVFECLARQLPFTGDTGYDYVRHLLSDAPRPLYRLAPNAPDALVRLVEQCLEKAPGRRPQSAAAVLEELRRIADGLLPSSSAPKTAGGARVRRRWRIAGAIVAVAAATLAVFAWNWRSRNPTRVDDPPMRQLTTSSGEEWRSRLSPDGLWVSYIAERGAATRVFVQRTGETQARVVDVSGGPVVDQLWSPDGSELAVLVYQGDKLTLQIVPFFGGEVRQTFGDLPSARWIRLVRWVERTMYVAIEAGDSASLLALALTPGSKFVDISRSWKVDGQLINFDVRQNAPQVVYTLRKNRRSELWTANLDGGSARRLIEDDTASDRYPIWRGRSDSVVFQSNRGGLIDLWEVSLATRIPRRLTTGPEVEIPESAAADGSVSFQRVSEKRTLWDFDPAGGEARQLTGEALSDLAPSASRDGRVLAFQRARPGVPGSELFGSSLLVVLRGENGAFLNTRTIDQGFQPLVSPDGRLITYLQRVGDERPRVCLRDLETDALTILSADGAQLSFILFPTQFVEQLTSWSASGREFYFVERKTGSMVRRYDVGTKRTDNVLAGETADDIAYIYPSADGRTLAYFARSDSRHVAELHLVDLTTQQDRVLTKVPFELLSPPFLLGWLARDAGLVLGKRTQTHDDLTNTVEVVKVSLGGSSQSIRAVGHVHAPTMRLMPARGEVFMTRSQDGIHNVFALSLGTGTIRAVTTNTNVDTGFSGMGALGPDRLVGVRQEKGIDIWLLEAHSQPQPRSGASGRRP